MAPRPDLFAASPRALELLNSLPPVVHEEPDIRAAVYAQAKESERQETVLNALLREFFPTVASERGIAWWEKLLQLPVNLALPLEQRRVFVLGHLRSMAISPGLGQWILAVTAIVGPGWAFQEHVPDGQPAPPTQKRNEFPNPRLSSNANNWANGSSAGYLNITAGRAAMPDAAGQFGFRFKADTPADTTSRAGGIVSPIPLIAAVAGERWSASVELYTVDASVGRGAFMEISFWDSAFASLGPAQAGPETPEVVGGRVTVKAENKLAPANTAWVRATGRLFTNTASDTIDTYWTNLLVHKGAAVPPWSFPDAQYLGAADASVSVYPPTPANPPPYTIAIQLPFPPSSGNYARAERAIRELTPIHLDLQLSYIGGFLLDQSQLDQEGL